MSHEVSVTELEALLAGIVADPREETRWLVLADWLQEHDDPRRAELLRLHRKLIATCCEPDMHPQRAEWQSRMVELLVTGVKPCVPQQTLTLPGGVPMTFSFIPPGAFLMGATVHAIEMPIHWVRLTNGFFMGVSTVTQSQWKAVMGTEPSQFTGPSLPVDSVSWNDCQEFCAKVSGTSGQWEARLPTEAEWEYACRAGTTTEYHFGDVLDTDLANYNAISSWNNSAKGVCRQTPTVAASFPANAWGLYDMHGNVWEWCADWYRDYSAGEKIDPHKQSTGRHRVLRGGAWNIDPEFCRAAYREWLAPERRISEPTRRINFYFGLRVCLRL